MVAQIGLLLLGLVLLTAGAELLVRGGASLARRLGLAPLVVGLTIVAFGTSAPEMVVSVGSAAQGRGDIAVGNVVGSNIFNVGFILGLAAVISPLRITLGLIKIDVPIMVAATLAAAWLTTFAAVPRLVGVLFVLLLIAYTALSIRLAKRQAASEAGREFEEGIPRATRSLRQDVLFIGVGLVLLFLGGGIFVESSSAIARLLGVSEAVIGLTIVAAGTSMPELATSIVAALRKQSDIAVGNIVGSNIFNILGILGLAVAVEPVSAPGIAQMNFWVMIGYAIVLLPLLWTGQRLERWEGMLLLGGYIAYLWFLWPER